MPKASIVVPCYNAAEFVANTISSAQAQTVRDIEIICVNDGSKDNTLKILEDLARKDSRIRIIDQENGGEGPARDAGLLAATGEWLYFLDADDLMEPTLLEKAIATGERDESDIVVFRTLMLNAKTGEEWLCGWSFKRDWMPADHFCPREHPGRIFNSFQNWVHNKLFRGDFVRSHNLRFQHVHRTADLLFTCRALAEASRISLLEEPLHHYRVNNPQSAMATSDSYPLDFYEAFAALRASLEANRTWDLYHDSFVNWAIDGVITNLRLVRSYEGFLSIATKMRREGFVQLDIVGFPREKTDNPLFFDLTQVLINSTIEEALFHFMATYRNRLSCVEDDISRCRMERVAYQELQEQALRDTIRDYEHSASLRIGKAITAMPRMARHLLRGV